MRKYRYHQAIAKKTKTESLPPSVENAIRKTYPRLVDFIKATHLDLVMHRDVFYRAMREGKCSARAKSMITIAWHSLNVSKVPRHLVESGLDQIRRSLDTRMTRAELLTEIIKLNNIGAL